jgi:hypothetical protein
MSAQLLIQSVLVTFSPLNFSVDIPPGLLEILDGVVFQVCTPDVLDGVAKTKAHVLGDLDALDT